MKSSANTCESQNSRRNIRFYYNTENVRVRCHILVDLRILIIKIQTSIIISKVNSDYKVSAGHLNKYLICLPNDKRTIY